MDSENKPMLSLTRGRSTFLIAFMMVLIIVAVVRQRNRRGRSQVEFKTFYSSALAGRIQDEVITRKGSVLLKINNEFYTFYPYTSDLNNNSIFESISVPGDSVFKRQNADTLFLVHDKKVYAYTFSHFDQ